MNPEEKDRLLKRLMELVEPSEYTKEFVEDFIVCFIKDEKKKEEVRSRKHIGISIGDNYFILDDELYELTTKYLETEKEVK